MSESIAGIADVRSIAGAKARRRIEEQRLSFDRLVAAIAKAGFKDAARAFRAEADRAIERAREFEEERLARDEDRVILTRIRADFDEYGVPATHPDDGHALTDVERLEWMVYNSALLKR
jgi:hypothetical protein